MFGVGVGVGCAIMGLAPFFYELNKEKGREYATITISVGFALTLGTTIGRMVFK